MTFYNILWEFCYKIHFFCMKIEENELNFGCTSYIILMKCNERRGVEMRKKFFQLSMLVISLTLVMGLFINISNQNQVEAEDEGENTYATEQLSENAIFTKIDENGNTVIVDDEELEESGIIVEEPLKYKFRSAVSRDDILKERGVVNFRTKSSGSNTLYVEDSTGREGYTNGTYAADAAYLGHNSDRTKVKFMLAGVIGWVNASEVQVLDFSDSAVQTLSKYYVKNGRLYHGIVTNLSSKNYSSNLDVGPKPSYLKEGKQYYSYDGHYFYDYDNTNGYIVMLNDYRNDTRKNSVNPNNPYYNYYQYLPQRSQSVYTANQLNEFINKNTSSNSKLRNLGQSLIENQNKYGVNAMMTLGIAINESAWGTSSIAQNKNNLFGHEAYDSDPNGSANKYSTPSFSIYYHTSSFMSKQYSNPTNWKYHGNYLGDKASGVNLKYASDPYWGEKAAHYAWKLDEYFGYKDSFKYTIGIKDVYNYQFTQANIKSSSSNSSTTLYKAEKDGVLSNYAFINLNNSSSNGFYKIQSDAVINANRTGIVTQSEYSFSKNYAYISNKNVVIISKGSNSSSIDVTTDNTTPTYKKGDVNGDGKVSTLDYIAIENHIMERSKLSGDKLKRADVNEDGKVSTLDYIAIENHIMGRKLLF